MSELLKNLFSLTLKNIRFYMGALGWYICGNIDNYDIIIIIFSEQPFTATYCASKHALQVCNQAQNAVKQSSSTSVSYITILEMWLYHTTTISNQDCLVLAYTVNVQGNNSIFAQAG